MEKLNAHIRHVSCSQRQRTEVLELKYRFIKLLHEKGFCSKCWRHPNPRQCYDYDGIVCRDCEYCDFGVVWEGVSYYVGIEIDGDSYIWRLRDRLFEGFAPKMSIPPHEWDYSDDEEPIKLTLVECREAKALIRWILDDDQQ